MSHFILPKKFWADYSNDVAHSYGKVILQMQKGQGLDGMGYVLQRMKETWVYETLNYGTKLASWRTKHALALFEYLENRSTCSKGCSIWTAKEKNASWSWEVDTWWGISFWFDNWTSLGPLPSYCQVGNVASPPLVLGVLWLKSSPQDRGSGHAVETPKLHMSTHL